MTLKLLQLLLAIIAAISGSRMSTIARNEKGKSQWFASIFDVMDYIEITRQETGRIGNLFWIFLVSFISFIALIILPLLFS